MQTHVGFYSVCFSRMPPGRNRKPYVKIEVFGLGCASPICLTGMRAAQAWFAKVRARLNWGSSVCPRTPGTMFNLSKLMDMTLSSRHLSPRNASNHLSLVYSRHSPVLNKVSLQMPSRIFPVIFRPVCEAIACWSGRQIPALPKRIRTVFSHHHR